MTDFTISRKIVVPAPRDMEVSAEIQAWVERRMQEFIDAQFRDLVTYEPVMPERVHLGEHWGIYRIADIT